MTTVELSIPPAAKKLDKAAVEAFRHRLTGVLVRPGDQGYDAACAVWNGIIHRRPALIAYCANRQDVIECVDFARTTGILTAVRSGGHNIAGASLCDGGLVIDLSRMNRVTVDPENRTALAEGGALLADLDAATQTHGVATTTGVNSDTGLIGLTLGGGIGRLGRKHGLSCDNMLSAEVVTADARVLNASERENADLFWGLRGGGGNFGIVTSITYRLYPLGPTVLAHGNRTSLNNTRPAHKHPGPHLFRRHGLQSINAMEPPFSLLSSPSRACTSRRVAESGNERAPFHSITSSARASRDAHLHRSH